MRTIINAAWVAFFAFTWSIAAVGQDWPTYQGDNSRSARAALDRAMPIAAGAAGFAPKWIFESPRPPERAWSELHEEVCEGWLLTKRMAFDEVFQVTVSDGTLFFGSSADNRVYALDAAGGAIRWTFWTGGPVRCAPTIHDGKVYFGSDDGWVYCLNAANGKPVWKFRAGPNASRVIGNGRIISRWPVRTGVLVDGGVAYFCAGFFPSEGVYVCALDALTGRTVWINDRVQVSDAGRASIAPQGYLLCSKDTLFVPSSRGMPWAFERNGGKLRWGDLVYSPKGAGGGTVGGTYALLDGAFIYSGSDQNVAFDEQSGKIGFAWYPGRRLIIDGDTAYLGLENEIKKIDRREYAGLTAAKKKIIYGIKEHYYRRQYLLSRIDKRAEEGSQKAVEEINEKIKSQLEEIAALDAKMAACEKWVQPITCHEAMILAGDALFCGGTGVVAAIDVGTGAKVFETAVDGMAAGLAFADGTLFVSTDRGKIYAYSSGASARPAEKRLARPVASESRAPEPVRKAVDGILDGLPSKKGFAVVLGIEDGSLMLELARRSELNVYGLERDPAKVQKAREAIGLTDLGGVRVTVDLWEAGDAVPYPDWCANLVTSESALFGRMPDVAASEIARIVRPAGGMAIFTTPEGGDKAVAGRMLAAIEPATAVTVADGRSVAVRREALPGGDAWTHQYASPGNTASNEDVLVRGPLEMLWYGEPGPNRLNSRHARPAGPLSANGRMFIQGIGFVAAYDAYNGTKLWENAVEGNTRIGMFAESSNVALDDESIFVAARRTCYRFRQADGGEIGKFQMPEEMAKGKWGYIAVSDGVLLGSHTPGFYSSAALFAFDVQTGAKLWTYEGKLRNNAITVGDGRVYLADADKKLLALGLKTGAVVWERPHDMTFFAEKLMLMTKHGLVTVCGSFGNAHYWPQFFKGDFADRSVAVFSGADGKPVWEKRIPYRIRPMIVGDRLLAEPWFFDLKTGAEVFVGHPISGAKTPWQFERTGHHCGAISASRNMLFFRSNWTGFYDLERDEGTWHFAGHRPGCWINIIPAGGVLLIPEASSGCNCGHPVTATVAFKSGSTGTQWGIYAAQGGNLPVKHLALNFGAPGDKRAPNGTLWIAYPPPSTSHHIKDQMRVTPDVVVEFLPGFGGKKTAGAPPAWDGRREARLIGNGALSYVACRLQAAPGCKYAISFKIKKDAESKECYALVVNYTVEGKLEKYSRPLGAEVPTDGEWHEVRGEFTTTATLDKTALYFYNNKTAGSAWIKEVTVEEKK